MILLANMLNCKILMNLPNVSPISLLSLGLDFLFWFIESTYSRIITYCFFWHESCLLQFPGEILACQLVNLGAKVILSARNVAELERVKCELVGKFITCHFCLLSRTLYYMDSESILIR